MQKHVKLYFKHYGYGEQDTIICQYCHYRIASDIHHVIYRSQTSDPDKIDNLIALCRVCHESAHRKIIKAEELQAIIANSLNAQSY